MKPDRRRGAYDIPWAPGQPIPTPEPHSPWRVGMTPWLGVVYSYRLGRAWDSHTGARDPAIYTLRDRETQPAPGRTVMLRAPVCCRR